MSPCACRIEWDEVGSDRIVYCPTHEAAFDLLNALAARTDHADNCVGHRRCNGFNAIFAEDFAKGRRLVARLRDGETIE